MSIAPRLRPDITVTVDGPGRRTLTDARTDFLIVIDGEDVDAVDALHQQRATAQGTAQGTALLELLSGLGLLDEGLDDREIVARQREVRRASRDEERFEALREALRFAVEHVPFHRERMRAAGMTPDDVQSLADLQRLPTMTKADVRARFPDGLLADGVDLAARLERGELLLGATSGTTDERLQVIADPRAGALPDDVRALWEMDRAVPLDRGAILTSPLCVGSVCHLGDMTTQERTHDVTLTLNSSDDIMGARDDVFRGIVDELQAFRPDVFFVNPWYAMWLRRRAQDLGLSLPSMSVILSGYQLLPARHRRVLGEAFSAPVFSYYSASELGGYMMGTECARGVMHAREDDVFLEILPLPGSEGQSDPQLGLVAVTTLRNRITPLVRYVIGDVVRVLPECGCARGSEWPAMRIEGRYKDFLRRADGSLVSVAAVDDAVGADDVDFYRLTQRGPKALRLEGIAARAGGLEDAAARLRALFDGAPDGGTVVDSAPVRRFVPERSLKFRTTCPAPVAPDSPLQGRSGPGRS